MCVGTTVVRTGWCTGVWYYFYLKVSRQHTDIRKPSSKVLCGLRKPGDTLQIIFNQMLKSFLCSSFQSPGSLQKQCVIFIARRLLVWTRSSCAYLYVTVCDTKMLHSLPPSCTVANSQHRESSFRWRKKGCVLVTSFTWMFSHDTLLDSIWIVNFALFSLHLNEEESSLFSLVYWVDYIHSLALPHCPYTIIYLSVHLLAHLVFHHEKECSFLSLFLAYISQIS